MDGSLILQVATFIVAAVGPFLAYHYARKLAVSANRQAWLDALRDDISELVALSVDVRAAKMMVSAREPAADRQSALNIYREQIVRLQTARYRIRLRLRAGNPLHDALIQATDNLIAAPNDEPDQKARRRDVVAAAEAVIQRVWKQIEKGR
jgi:ABC-type molybdate transport system ATPase subunit